MQTAASRRRLQNARLTGLFKKHHINKGSQKQILRVASHSQAHRYFTPVSTTGATRLKSGRPLFAQPKTAASRRQPKPHHRATIQNARGPRGLKTISHPWRAHGAQPLRASERPAGSRWMSRRHGFAQTKKRRFAVAAQPAASRDHSRRIGPARKLKQFRPPAPPRPISMAHQGETAAPRAHIQPPPHAFGHNRSIAADVSATSLRICRKPPIRAPKQNVRAVSKKRRFAH